MTLPSPAERGANLGQITPLSAATMELERGWDDRRSGEVSHKVNKGITGSYAFLP
jgi:hypothetical protein